MRKALGLSYTVLSDPDTSAIKLYGVLNEKAGKLPHPASFVVDSKGIVRYRRVDEDYTKRPLSAELLNALDGIREP